MRLVVRLAVGLVGLAAAVYGFASLTGGWLGTPPWWKRLAPMDARAWLDRHRPDSPVPKGYRMSTGWTREWDEAEIESDRNVDPCESREWISGGAVSAGLALGAFVAWPRRSAPRPTGEATDGLPRG